MTKTEIITLINLWIDFQNEDQPRAPRDGEKRIEWFADKNQTDPGETRCFIEEFLNWMQFPKKTVDKTMFQFDLFYASKLMDEEELLPWHNRKEKNR